MRIAWIVVASLLLAGCAAEDPLGSPDRHLPERCVVDVPGFSCLEHRYDGQDLNVHITQTTGLVLEQVRVSLDAPDCSSSDVFSIDLWESRERQSFSFSCENAPESVDGKVVVEYRIQGGQEMYTAKATVQASKS